MPKRTSKKKKRRSPEPDVNQLAHRLVQESTAEVSAETMTKEQISKLMKEMGKKGGKVGGVKRMAMLTPEQRSELGLKAARARWPKKPA
jgi:hypothetical protein